MGALLGGIIGGIGNVYAANIQARSADRAAAEQRAAAQQAIGYYDAATGKAVDYYGSAANRAAGLYGDAARQAAGAYGPATQKAADAAMTGYNYLTSGQGAQASNTYINNGMTANNSIAQLLGQAPMGDGASSGFQNYLNSTGYQFQLGQGMDAVSGNAASKGLLNSGGTAKALQQYGQNLSATTFNNYLQQLGGLSGAGQAGLNMVSGAGSYGGANAAQAYMQGASGQANAYLTGAGGQANAYMQGANGQANAVMQGAAGSGNALTGTAYNAGVMQMQGADATATGYSNALGSWLSAPWGDLIKPKTVGSA